MSSIGLDVVIREAVDTLVARHPGKPIEDILDDDQDTYERGFLAGVGAALDLTARDVVDHLEAGSFTRTAGI